jgi:hypothetical protein
MNVRIGENEYPVFFDWLSIESISESIGHNSLDVTVGNFQALTKNLKFIRSIAFHGVQGGFRKEKKQCPFETSEDLFAGVAKFGKMTALVELYTKAFLEFYNDEDSTETDKKKVTP